MLGGATNIGARIDGPGVVNRFSPFCNVTIGEAGGGLSERVEKILKISGAWDEFETAKTQATSGS